MKTFHGILAGVLIIPFWILKSQADPVFPAVKEIRLEKHGDVLSIAELKVFRGGRNIAGTGKAEQSSTFGGCGAGLAIDGNTEGNFNEHSVTHTAPKDAAPWWRLTLPEAGLVEEIEVWNRTEAVTERMNGVSLRLFGENKKLLAETVLENVSPVVRFRFTGSQLVPAPENLLASKESSFADADGQQVRYVLHYDRPAPIDLKGWECQSLPLGNGHFGVSFFGGIAEECWQFTEKSFCIRDDTLAKEAKAWNSVGLSDLMDLRLTMNHGEGEAQGYGRELELDRAIGRVRYIKQGVEYRRELFTSYPDRLFAARLTASKPGSISFQLRAVQPYLGPSRSGTAEACGSQLILRGITQPYKLAHEIRIEVVPTGGKIESHTEGADGILRISGADEAVVYVTLGTSYKLSPQVFLQSDSAKKLDGCSVPSDRIKTDLASAIAKGFASLKTRHVADYFPLFDRSDIYLGGKPGIYLTDKLRSSANKTREQERYLEALYFQYGRYLLIASSRKGTLPANLQGTWNMHRNAPWTGGYWANINIQMNYWPALVTGLEDCFEPYWDFFNAAFQKGEQIAASTLKSWGAGKVIDDGWTAGTGNSPYGVSGPGAVSGAGTGPFVLLPLWEWYQFTGDRSVLEKIWPITIASCRFLSYALKPQSDGTWLCDPSWSPENKRGNEPHVKLPGTAYDQELVYENYRIALETARIIGRDDPVLETVRKQMPHLSPVIIGDSGQLKEFRQEHAYGEFGELQHRHISHLVGLYPGTLIAEKREWMNAAKVSLNLRGDRSTGWAMAHRLNAWARIGDGDRAHRLLKTLLSKGTMDNLWDTHPPFQIDGNFGGTSGMAEMLLQSHKGVIVPLPALPAVWPSGMYRGLRARGGFRVSAMWLDGSLTNLRIESERGGRCKVASDSGWKVNSTNGAEVESSYDSAARQLVFNTQQGGVYELRPGR